MGRLSEPGAATPQGFEKIIVRVVQGRSDFTVLWIVFGRVLEEETLVLSGLGRAVPPQSDTRMPRLLAREKRRWLTGMRSEREGR